MPSSSCWISRIFTFATAAVRFGRLGLNSSTFGFNFVSVFLCYSVITLGTITVWVFVDDFLLFVIQLVWWRCLPQSVTFLQSPTSNVVNFYFLLWLSLRHQSGCMQVYLYDLDCVVLWELPGTHEKIFSTLLLYILTHYFHAF